MYSIPVHLAVRGTSVRPRSLRAEYDKLDYNIIKNVEAVPEINS